MRISRVVIGIFAGLILLAGLIASIVWINNRPASPDLKLVGTTPVVINDLPTSWQNLSDADMRTKLDELVADRLGERTNWYRGSFTQDDCRDIRLVAKYLGDDQLAVRSLCWLAHELQYDRQEGLAVDYLEIAIAEAEGAGLMDELEQSYLQKGNCLGWLGLYEWALDSYTKARELAHELYDPVRESYLMLKMTNVNYHRLMRFEDAMTLYDQLPGVAAQGVEPLLMIPKYSLWAMSLQSYGRYHEALDACQLALEAAEVSGEPDSIQSVLRLLATNNFELNRLAESEEYLNRAIALVPELERSNDIFDPHRLLASIYFLTDREDEAEALFLDTLDKIGIVETSVVGDEREESTLYQMLSEKVKTLASLGDLKLMQNDPETALEYFLQADKLNDGVEWVSPQENMATRLAQTYMELGRLEDAQAQLANSKDNPLLEFMPDGDRGDPEVLRRNGEIQLELGNLDEAQEYLESALDACLPVKIQEIIQQRSMVLLALGRLAEKQGDREQAEEHYRLAFDELLDTAREFPWNTLLKSILADDIEVAGQQLIALHESQGNQAEADEVRAILERVSLAKTLAGQSAPLGDEAAELALRNYRNTTTYLSTLRYGLYWECGVGMKDFDEKLKAINKEKNLKPIYRREFVRQLKSSRLEIEQKFTRLEGEAQEYLAELRRLDPETAAIIEM